MFKKIFLIIVILIIILLLVYFLFIYEKPMAEENFDLKGKKIALIIAQEGFQDKEFEDTKSVLEKQGAELTIVSENVAFPARGKFGLEVSPDIKIDDLKVDEFEAIVFIGGPGAANYVENETAHQIAREAIEKGKVIGAICIAPEILAKAGVLKDIEATVWSSPLDKTPIDILKEEGAKYVDEPVVISNKIVTANGPEAAHDFGQAIAQLIK